MFYRDNFQKTLTRFWTTSGVKYEHDIIDAIKRNTSDLELRKGNRKVGKQGVCTLCLKLSTWKITDLENLISFSVIYRFTGLLHEITDMLH